jgi:hypothetical protein
MDIPKDCIHNLQSDLSECLKVVTKDPHNLTALKECVDTITVLEYLDKCQRQNTAVVSKNATTANGINFFGMAVEELQGAENYFKLYQKTGDKRFLSMAKQELGHSAALSEMLKEHGNVKDAATLDGKRMQVEKAIM